MSGEDDAARASEDAVDRVLVRLQRLSTEHLLMLGAEHASAAKAEVSAARRTAIAAARRLGLEDEVADVQHSIEDWARRPSAGVSSAGLWGHLGDSDHSAARHAAYPAATDAAVATLLKDELPVDAFEALIGPWRSVVDPGA